MNETQQTQRNDRNDVLLHELLSQLKTQSAEMVKLTAQYHSIEMQLATLTATHKGQLESLTATHKGRDDQTHYRLNELEEWRSAANKYMITFMLTVLAGFVGVIVQAWLNAGGGK